MYEVFDNLPDGLDIGNLTHTETSTRLQGRSLAEEDDSAVLRLLPAEDCKVSDEAEDSRARGTAGRSRLR